MDEINHINLLDLQELFYRGSAAERAAAILHDIRKGIARESVLNCLSSAAPASKKDKRSPRKRKALRIRGSFVSLLKFYSIIEISLLISFVPEPNHDVFWVETAENLLLPRVRTFYEETYVMLLPRFLRMRLGGWLSLKEEFSSSAVPDFLSFLSMTRRIEQDKDLRYFVQLFSARPVDATARDEFMALIGSKEEFMQQALPTERASNINRALQGLNRFLIFCKDFDRLLQEGQQHPLLQSAMWNYHIDLFATPGERLTAELKTACGRFLDWFLDEPWTQYREGAEREIVEIISIMERLTSGQYGFLLEEQAYTPARSR